MSAAGFADMICWWFASKMTTMSISSVWISPIDFVWRACKRWTNMRVSASSWLHWPIGVPSPKCFTQSSSVMYSSFRSGNCLVDSILDRYVKSSFLLSASFNSFCNSATGGQSKDLNFLKLSDDRDVWRGMVANVCSRSGTWWWWWWFFKNVCQSLRTFTEPVTRCRQLCPRLSLVLSSMNIGL